MEKMVINEEGWGGEDKEQEMECVRDFMEGSRVCKRTRKQGGNEETGTGGMAQKKRER